MKNDGASQLVASVELATWEELLGLRIGEPAGLRRSRVDLLRGVVRLPRRPGRGPSVAPGDPGDDESAPMTLRRRSDLRTMEVEVRGLNPWLPPCEICTGGSCPSAAQPTCRLVAHAPGLAGRFG